VSVAVALAYVALVPAGQPYDEPAHWSNVEYYAHQERMPELGRAGVSYEAQQGPVYYALAAAIARPTAAMFDDKAAFYAVRIAGTLLVGAAVLLTFALSILLVPRQRGVALMAAAFVGLNPFFLAVGASVQNDYLALVLALVAALLAVRTLQSSQSSWTTWLIIGVLTGVATLTKLFAVGLLGGLGVAALCSTPRESGQRLRGFGLAALGFVAVSGWWFVRNIVLYGDLTARSGLEAAGIRYPPLPYNGLSSIGSWIRSLVAYVWVPTEYFRNVFRAPGVMRAVVIIITVGIALATAVGAREVLSNHRPLRSSAHGIAVVFLASWFGITFATYAVMTWAWTSFSLRLVYVAFPAAIVLVCASCGAAMRSLRLRSATAAGIIAVLLLISVFVLVKVNQIGRMPFQIHF
jgi:D-alanyl-D-alanine carboxypeptidase (penicillin-binding protein 5/6)